MAELDDDFTRIANEFATVLVRTIETKNGTRLEIVAPKLGYRTTLDPLELESLTWQDKEAFSAFLRTPFGPEEDLDDH